MNSDRLLRGEQVAATQLAKTMQEAQERGAGWTHEDFEILMHRWCTRSTGWHSLPGNGYEAFRNYRTHLNA